jgi:ubiquinone/menaquinone biosynthesis C-methylase UbiE
MSRPAPNKGKQVMKHIISVLLLVFSGLVVANIAEQSINPGINRHYLNAQFQDWVGIFEQPGREVYDKRHAVVKALNLKPGMNVADIGAGTGFYSLLFAEKVGKTGHVFAVDITDDFILNINRRASEKNMKNIHGVVSTQKDTLLAPDSVDMAFVCDTYHHFEYPQTMLTSIRRALRSGGELIIIDFRKQPQISSSWVMSHVRTDKNTVIKEIEQAGFKFQSETDILKTNYFLRFVKNSNRIKE